MKNNAVINFASKLIKKRYDVLFYYIKVCFAGHGGGRHRFCVILQNVFGVRTDILYINTMVFLVFGLIYCIINTMVFLVFGLMLCHNTMVF